MTDEKPRSFWVVSGIEELRIPCQCFICTKRMLKGTKIYLCRMNYAHDDLYKGHVKCVEDSPRNEDNIVKLEAEKFEAEKLIKNEELEKLEKLEKLEELEENKSIVTYDLSTKHIHKREHWLLINNQKIFEIDTYGGVLGAQRLLEANPYLIEIIYNHNKED